MNCWDSSAGDRTGGLECKRKEKTRRKDRVYTVFAFFNRKCFSFSFFLNRRSLVLWFLNPTMYINASFFVY